MGVELPYDTRRLRKARYRVNRAERVGTDAAIAATRAALAAALAANAAAMLRAGDWGPLTPIVVAAADAEVERLRDVARDAAFVAVRERHELAGDYDPALAAAS